MFGGFPSGFHRSHRWTHAAVRVPSSLLRCRVDIGTRNIVPYQMNHTIVIASCLTCSFQMGNICAMCRILASRKVCTYWIRWMRHTSRPYISLTCPATLVQLLFPDWSTVLENWNARMVISLQYGMFIMFTVVFQAPAVIAFDFRMFTRAPFAFSYLRSVSANAGISFGSVTNRVICIRHYPCSCTAVNSDSRECLI